MTKQLRVSRVKQTTKKGGAAAEIDTRTPSGRRLPY